MLPLAPRRLHGVQHGLSFSKTKPVDWTVGGFFFFAHVAAAVFHAGFITRWVSPPLAAPSLGLGEDLLERGSAVIGGLGTGISGGPDKAVLVKHIKHKTPAPKGAGVLREERCAYLASV